MKSLSTTWIVVFVGGISFLVGAFFEMQRCEGKLETHKCPACDHSQCIPGQQAVEQLKNGFRVGSDYGWKAAEAGMTHAEMIGRLEETLAKTP